MQHILLTYPKNNKMLTIKTNNLSIFAKILNMKKTLLLLFIAYFFTANSQVVKDTTKQTNSPEISTISISSTDVDEDGGKQDISSLLQGSKDVFVNTASYTFSSGRFSMRGYESENSSVFMNGIEMNDAENGRVFHSYWGGLNDATRNKQYSNGLDQSEFAFGGIGGSTNITTRASEYKKGTSASYAISNRSYRNRLMITHSTGLMNNGFAITASASKRWAQQGYVEGTSYDGYSYFASLEKKFSKNHSLGLTAYGAPTKRGMAGGSTQEAYDLLNNNYYNPNWGYQNGEVRNAKINTSNKPQIILTDYFNPSEKTTITTSLGYSFGSYQTTALDWYNTRDPRPDYYRYLPSYYDNPTAVAAVENAFIKETEDINGIKNGHQLDWDYFYNINANNEDGASSYIVENRITDFTEIKANTIINHKLNDKITIDGGLFYNYYKGHHYKTIGDLLGGEYYLDIDKFAERDFPNDADMIDNNLLNPDKERVVGDVFGYDYDINKKNYGAWGQVSAKLSKIDLFASLKLSNTTFWRTGYMMVGKFPENSYGDSKKNNFFNYGLKGGATYKLNGRNYFYAEGYYGTNAPLIKNAYISPRTRDFVVEGLDNETILSTEGGYNLRAPKIKARASFYYTQFKNQTEVYSFYNDLYSSYTNQIITGINKTNMGIELGAEATITSTISTTAAIAMGQYIYSNNPLVTSVQDNDASLVATPTTIYQNNYFQANGPQNAYSLGLKYNHPKFWFVNLNANYFSNNYLEFNPDRRTDAAVKNPDGTAAVEPDSELWNQILNQEKLDNAFTIDLFGGKSWRIKKYTILLNVGVNNILDNTNFITGGYEQRRFDYENKDVTKFPSKYFYSYGRNYFISLTVRI